MSSRANTQQPVTVRPGSTQVTTEPNAFYTFDNEWHRPFFGSFTPCPRSAFACFCCCCYTASLVNRTGDGVLSCLCNPCALAGLRTKVRTAFHIRGTLMEDCCVSICCPCAAMQIEKELDHQNIPRQKDR